MQSNNATQMEGTVEWRMAHEVIWIAGGFYFYVFGFIGDMEFLADVYNAPRTTAINPCAWCPCNSDDSAGGMPWSDFRTLPDLALWMRNIYTRANWLNAGLVFNALLELPGMSSLNIMPDLMHVKYLGTDKYVLGSVMHLLVYVLLPGIAV